MIRWFVFLVIYGMFSAMSGFSSCRAAEAFPNTGLSNGNHIEPGVENSVPELDYSNVAAWYIYKHHPYEKVPAAAMLMPPPNNQDCPDAIPICQDVYSTVVSYSGTGNIPNEINPANSCLANGERNDVWYTFTVQTSGNLNFLITPVDSVDDYDWAVYNLTTANCSDIYSTPALMKSCNYSLTPGTTGPNGGSASNNQNALGSPYNAVIPVVAGQTYVINVSNFSASASGFTIDFTASTAQIYDNVPPQLQSIATPVVCGASSITANFSENILCSTLQNGDFSLTGPGGPYTITGWSSVGCTAGANYDNTVTVTFSPPLNTTGNFDFCLTNSSGSVTDLCGNVAPPVCISFSINGVTTVIAGTNVSCYGGSNGTATVVAAGGSGAYVYTWSPSGGSSATATGLPAGTYTVTVTDGTSCSSTASIVIVEPGIYTANISAPVNVSCFGGTNGSATAGVAGGTAPFGYSWSNGSGSQVNTGLAAGTYTVTATDNNGCTATASVTITQPPDLVIGIVGTDASCNGAADGTGSVNVNGGVPAYSYLWSNGSTANPSSFTAGSYTVTVTDANGCAESSGVVISEPTAIVLNTNSVDASCGSSNGSATVNANGGSPGYSYAWSNGTTTSVNSSLTAGAYDVTVTDSHGCTSVTTVNVGSLSGPVVVISASSDVTCNGNSDGTATANVNGGAAPYSYLWSDGETNSTASNLGAGNYAVTVTDANGCVASASGSINEPAALVLNIVVTDVLCNGGNNGDATVNVNGGTPPFSYAWSNGNTNSSNNNLSAGNYTVTVTDGNGCSMAGSVSVAEPLPLALVQASTDVLCNGGSDGVSSVVVNGGTGPYDYLWSNGNSNDNISGLVAGTYTITVTDNNGCTSTSSATINEPSPMVLNTNSVDASCGSSNGSASVNVNGGTPGYTYLWSNGATTSANNSLASGAYDVTVTDAAGCTQVQTVNVGSLTGPVANISGATDVLCNGGSDGSAVVNAAGGTLPYTYLWSNGSTTAAVNNLSAGNQSATITDANGCVSSASVQINEPPALVLNPTGTDVLCNGGNSGNASVIVNGGTPPYSYQWSNGVTNDNINNLTSGSYTVTVTDNNGCTTSTIILIAEPPVLILAPAATDASCNGGSDGTVSVNVNGGTNPYGYLWSNGDTNDNVANLSAGSYTVTVTDASGCVEVTTSVVNEPSVIVLNTNSNPAACGSSNGSASVIANGGTPGYTYLWSDGTTTAANNGIASGPYDITVTDAAGCPMTATVNVGNTAGPVANIAASSDVSCNGGSDGTASVNVNGGVAPYSYAWTNGSTTAFANAIPAGNQSVTVTDANGCVSSASVMINEPPALNLNISGTDVLCSGGNTGDASVVVNGGTPAYLYDWSNGNTNDVISNLNSGNYTVTVTDNNGCSATGFVVIAEPQLLVLVPATTDVSCNGGTNGSVSVNANGGTAPYSYAWSNGDTNDNLANLSSGSYTVTVTDAAGCTEVITIEVNEPSVIILNTNTSPAACGSSNGSASVNANGGTPGYTYLWSDGTTNAIDNGIPSGPYDITVTDAAGCTIMATVNVGNTAGPVANIAASTDVSCNGGSDGSATVNVNGGVAPYAYLWTSGSTTAIAGNVPAGNQAVTVTDANGCVTSVSVVINEPTALNLNTSGTDVLCNGNSSGDATVVVNGGISPYLYLWSNGTTNDVTTGLPAGNYTVTVTDSHGCTSTGVVTIAEPLPLLLAPASTDATCYGATDGSASVNANGGTSPYTYLWTSGSTDDNIGNQSAGTYTVTVTDAAGCSGSATVQVSEPSQIVLNTADSPANCGSANGSASVNVNGGTPGYSYLWSNGETTAVNNSLAAGPYDITVTDANGCTQMSTVNVPNTAGPVANISASSDVTCNGFSDGSATVVVNGGTAPYSYLWSDGTTISSISNVPAGNYAVTVTDGTGCVASAAVLINEPTPVNLNITTTDVLCNGGNNGDATVLASGGVLPYIYLWSSGGTNDLIGNMTSGSYTVTVTDGNGCISTGNANIAEPSQLAAIINITGVLCNGGSDGNISVIVNGGVTPYDYSWSTGSTDDNISNIPSGTYTVTVTDYNGCSLTISAVINDPGAIVLNVNTSPAACGTSNGSASVVVNGGTPGYSYLWSNGVTASANNGLAAGSYDVTVTDANGCSQFITANVSNTAGPIANISSSNDVSCNGGSDGSISVNVNGGSLPYVYLWSNGATTVSINNIPAGNYSLTITDAIGCASAVSLLINEPIALNLVSNITDALCNGASTGAVSIVVNGGVLPYTYNWSNGDTNSSLSNINAANYTITVTDNNNCTSTAVINVAEPPALVVAPSSTGALCNGSSDGTVSVIANGGTGPYGYLWSQGDTNDNISGLPGGTYTVTVSDANGCTMSATTSINNPVAMTIGKNTVSATCGSSNGSATAIPNGGTSPYSYLWSNGATTATANNIPAAAYQVTVTDASGCTATKNITVANSSGPLVAIAGTTDVTCNSGVDGSVTVNVNGGALPYSYLWSNGDTTLSINNIAAGNYTITVTDDNGCQSSASALIIEPSLLVIVTAKTNVLCNGDNTGTASVVANGSVSPYTYLWSNGDTNDILNTVPAATYTVTVTDSHGCTASAPVNVSQPPALALVPASVDAICNAGSDGSVSVNVNGGNNPYIYLWSNAATDDNVSALTAGTYTVTVTDDNGCSSTVTAVVGEPAAITIGKNTVAAICGSSNGSATAVPSGGTGPYAFAWSTGSTNNVINGIPAGNYQVTVTDANGCTNSRNINVPNSAGPVVNIAASTDVNCNGGNDGSATLNVISGLLPYTYLWSDGSSASALSNVIAGNYSVTVTDANGCATAASVLINEPSLLVINPAITDVLCHAGSSGALLLTPSGSVSPYSYLWSNGDTNDGLNNIPAGNYTVVVTDDHGCTMTANLNINEPAVLTASPSSTDATCNSGNDGSVSVVANGGTGPYSYLWTTGDTGGNVAGLSLGSYTVTVTDNHGCTVSATAPVGEPAPIIINNSTVGAICGASNGSATAIPSGGAVPYSYLWANGTTTAILQNVTAGSYQVTVSDFKGCTATALINVPNAAGPVPNVIETNISCFGLSDGSATVQTVGGAAPYTYLWSTGDTLVNISSLDTGSYLVTVTDNNGCVSSTTFNITEPQVLAANIISQDVLCNGGNTGWAKVNGSGGTLPFNFLWSNGLVADSIYSLSANTFTVTVTDNNGCTISVNQAVGQPAPVILAASSTDASCNGLSDGSLLAQVNGGITPYSFLWSNAETTSAVQNITSGSYTITVTDGNGCMATATTSVLQPAALGINYQVVSTTCGASNGSATVQVNGGSVPYLYSWSNGATGSSISGITAATYTVTVTDQHFCSIVQVILVGNLAGPAASISASQNASCNGASDGSATAVANGGALPLSFAWSNGETTATINNLVASNYTVTITDFNGCVASTSVVISQPGTLVPAITPANVLCFGTATGSAIASASGGTPPYQYNWSNSQVSDTITSLISGTYTLTVTDSHACTASTTVVISQPAVLATTITSTPALCFGSANGVAQVNVTGGSSPYSYNWSNGSTLFAANGLVAGNYSVTVTDGNGCITSASTIVGQAAALNIQSNVSPVLCHGGNTGAITVAVTGGTLNYNYQWSAGSATGPASVNLFAGTYTVTVTDAHNCTLSSGIVVAEPDLLVLTPSLTNVTCFGLNNGTASITPSGGVAPYVYSWTNGATTAGPLPNLSPGIYSVVVTDYNSCTCFASLQVQQPTQLLLNAYGASTICIGQQAPISATATGGTGNYNFSWSNGCTNQNQIVSPPATTTYTVNVTDANNCTTTKKTVQVTVFPALGVVASGDVKICDGENVAIWAQGSGGNGGPYAYSWNNSGGNTANIVVSPHLTTTYTVTVSDNCGTPVAQTTVTVIVNPLPIVDFDILPDEGCVPLVVSFHNLSTTSLKAYYLWNFGDGNSDTLKNPEHIYLEEGTYDVSLQVTSDEGCVSALNKKSAVHVYGIPVAGFSADPPKTSILHPLISFTDKSTGADFWDWNFGDGMGGSSQRNPQYLYQDTGTFEVRLIVENIHTCTDTISEQVIVEQDFTLYIPNAFTPNNDGTNDVFMLKGIGVDNLQFFIFDRWGKRVFNGNSINDSWNGTIDNRGVQCQEDAYVYLVKVVNFKGEPKEFTGTVTLLR